MKIAFFAAGGPFALLPLRTLWDHHEIVLVVRPDQPIRWSRRLTRWAARAARLRHRDDVGEWVRARAIPAFSAVRSQPEHLSEAVRRSKAGMICISTFPWIIDPMVLQVAPHGALNLHPSLLPRHRGPNPLFWTYYHNDSESGVSLHRATAVADGGPLLGQVRISIPRGWPSRELYLSAAREGARLMSSAVQATDDGSASPMRQDESLATYAPRVRRGVPMADFASWGAERVWHFLKGLYPWFREPLRDRQGRPIRYGSVDGLELRDPSGDAGELERTPSGWRVWCLDGCVHLGRPGLFPPLVSREP